MSWVREAFKVFKAMRTVRPIDYRDISARTGMSDSLANKCICRLRMLKCVVFVHGSARTGRYYMLVDGAEFPEDRRGKTELSASALARARVVRHHRASRPISQITAGRLKP